jgi:hypothetical protein
VTTAGSCTERSASIVMNPGCLEYFLKVQWMEEQGSPCGRDNGDESKQGSKCSSCCKFAHPHACFVPPLTHAGPVVHTCSGAAPVETQYCVNPTWQCAGDYRIWRPTGSKSVNDLTLEAKRRHPDLAQCGDQGEDSNVKGLCYAQLHTRQPKAPVTLEKDVLLCAHCASVEAPSSDNTAPVPKRQPLPMKFCHCARHPHASPASTPSAHMQM